MNRFKSHYEQIIRPNLLYKQCFQNANMIPEINAIIIHVSFKHAIADKKRLLPIFLALEYITGQQAVFTKALKSISNLKLKKDMLLGCKVTLRGDIMYTFLDKLVTTVLPKIHIYNNNQPKKATQTEKDGLDGHGQFSIGIKDGLFFTEIEQEAERFKYIQGMDVTIKTSSNNNIIAKILLSSFQIPFTNALKI